MGTNVVSAVDNARPLVQIRGERMSFGSGQERRKYAENLSVREGGVKYEIIHCCHSFNSPRHTYFSDFIVLFLEYQVYVWLTVILQVSCCNRSQIGRMTRKKQRNMTRNKKHQKETCLQMSCIYLECIFSVQIVADRLCVKV